MFFLMGFKQMFAQPTNKTVLGESCIDHVLTKDHNIITCVVKTYISDQFEDSNGTNFFVETMTAKNGGINFPLISKNLKIDNYCCKFLFELLSDPQKI